MDDTVKNRRRGAEDDLRFNPKRKLRVWTEPDQATKAAMADRVVYTGNPQHKRNPGDFDLHPPSAPRQNATLCDEAGISHRAEAQKLLRSGVEAGLVSERMQEGLPTQIWMVRGDVVFEAQLENAVQGHYHGYPMPLADPFRLVVLERAQKL
ncbi:MAG: hypothetical protein J0H01_28920 [Rhizobiales bacterium]|nr:hypothetical protein [Hyphomicrobiales bacterium]